MQKRSIASFVASILVALIGAFVLWLYVVTSVTPEATTTVYNIPITLEGSIMLEENGLKPTVEEKTVNLELRGSRSNLNKLTKENIRVTANLSDISREGTYTRDLLISFPAISGGNSIEVLRKSISSVEVIVTKVVTKPFQLEISWEGSAKEGYYFDSSNATIELSTGGAAEVVVSGPESEVNTVERAVVRCGDISDLTETIREVYPIVLLDADGQDVTLSEFSSMDETEATVTLPILKNRELTLKVGIIDGGGATAENAELTYSTSTVSVRGTAAVIDELDEEYIIGEIDLAKTGINDLKVFKLTLPAGVKNVSGVTEVEVRIKLVGLTTTTIFVDAEAVTLLNVPQNADAKLSAEKIPVTLRGTPESISEITVDDLKITVDLHNMTASGERQATVTVSNYPDVGVFGVVMVEIDLS